MQTAVIEHSADIHIRHHSGMTPLHAAAGSAIGFHRGRVDIMQVLLDHGAIIDAEDNKGVTPLQLALEERRDNVATWLKEHGATR